MTTVPAPRAERLYTIVHTAVDRIAGPLLVVEGAEDLTYGEFVDVAAGVDAHGAPLLRRGQVLEVDGGRAVVQVFGGTAGVGRAGTTVVSRGRPARTGVGLDLLGRVLDGAGRPRDGGPDPVADQERDVNGLPLNPVARDHPDEFIETGVSAIDALLTLVRGQKLPIFSGYGLPADELAARIATEARVPGDQEGFAVVFAAMGVTRRTADFFTERLVSAGSLARSVLLLNLAEDPTVERILTPRVALTIAEHLAYEHDLHVLVVLTDMTSYCEALREISAAREELPGRRGYPGYMYTDLATLYERAGRVRGRSGSVTQLPILSMPDDDISHPVPDLTGYITEGQVVLSRELTRTGVSPPIDVLPSLSRLMNAGIGAGRTREDHRPVADQLYACHARGVEVRRLLSIVGEGALSEEDRRSLAFSTRFEREFVGQGDGRRSIAETLDLAWQLLAPFPDDELGRIPPALRERFRPGT
ncbi:ATP synthase subunit B [Modestobacter marinus]|uniref:V-type ATP synthase beta chain n=1 Tax=Modestobacter marinus TaxID=477641 RepID=A0A846LG39_9ACTN|nr:V-type ATP synthase subunit B [Modestobacter marinus]NIH65574.1 V/A-type H+-transporting ATPase subunit B [Modestobacter marinus]GGL65509.1 V-type ATP synthase subunit B [Modestobacter marinus]